MYPKQKWRKAFVGGGMLSSIGGGRWVLAGLRPRQERKGQAKKKKKKEVRKEEGRGLTKTN